MASPLRTRTQLRADVLAVLRGERDCADDPILQSGVLFILSPPGEDDEPEEARFFNGWDRERQSMAVAARSRNAHRRALRSALADLPAPDLRVEYTPAELAQMIRESLDHALERRAHADLPAGVRANPELARAWLDAAGRARLRHPPIEDGLVSHMAHPTPKRPDASPAARVALEGTPIQFLEDLSHADRMRAAFVERAHQLGCFRRIVQIRPETVSGDSPLIAMPFAGHPHRHLPHAQARNARVGYRPETRSGDVPPSALAEGIGELTWIELKKEIHGVYEFVPAPEPAHSSADDAAEAAQ